MAKRQAAGRTGRKAASKRKPTGTKKKTAATRATAATPPAQRTGFQKAVALYDKGVRALQTHDYAAAARLLQDVLVNHPAEASLHDRVRLYLEVCRRHLRDADPSPQTVDEYLYAATVAMNAGDRATALDHLANAQRQDPENDHALYMLGVIRSVNGEPEIGLEYLRKAIDANPDNRALVRHEPELEALRATEGFKLLLESTATSRRRPRSRRSR